MGFMKNQSIWECFIGVDVSKDKLDISVEGKVVTIKNRKQEIQTKLIGKLSAPQVTLVVVEAIGCCFKRAACPFEAVDYLMGMV
jgi:hypothetical protein